MPLRFDRAFNNAGGTYDRMVRPSGERLLKLTGENDNGKELANVVPLEASLRLPL